MPNYEILYPTVSPRILWIDKSTKDIKFSLDVDLDYHVEIYKYIANPKGSHISKT